MHEKTLVIVGAGGFGREVFHWAEDQIIAGQADYTKLAFVDDNATELKPLVADHFRGTIQDFSPRAEDRVVIAIGKPTTRRKIANLLGDRGAQFGAVIHPSAIVARSSTHGEGLIICPNSTISVDCTVGRHLHINHCSTIGHDTVIGDFVTLSSHVDVMGNCRLEDEIFLGSGARVLPGCSIAVASSIGAGATVQRSIKKTSVLYQVATKRM
ncbi:acetyltransferase [Amylibacter marinus]|uniref:Acetyltransferase n=2 Tax=Amylibacter marinus TaxID=1475483 RepID=A0ABQ5VXW3_9RHOB|nr:acetyltransferase [Amylibacter marinus]